MVLFHVSHNLTISSYLHLKQALCHSLHVNTCRTGTHRCMSCSKLWLAECLPLLYHRDATTNQTGIELRSPLVGVPNASNCTTAIHQNSLQEARHLNKLFSHIHVHLLNVSQRMLGFLFFLLFPDGD